MAFSPDGAPLVAGSRDATVRLWDIVTGRGISRLESDHGVYVDSADFSRDGAYLATGYAGTFGNYRATLWDVASGEEVTRFLGHEAR